MVFSVGDVETISTQRETLRAIKSSLVERAVCGASLAGADGLDQSSIEFSNDDAVVIRIGDEESIGICVREDLAGKCERQFADFCAFEHEFEGFFVQLAPGAKIG